MKNQGDQFDMVVSMTPEKIHHAISEMIANGVPYIDALITYAEKNNLEIESVADVVKKSSILKEKIRTEAVGLKMVKKDEQDLTDIVK
jgi:predicted nucleotide-binding protein (sugar kinase/HSP70/actin superfamily)